MANSSNSSHSRWLKIDFHTHTPASNDFGKKDQAQREIKPEDWLKKAMEEKLDCIIVTDHNSGNWIDKLKQAMTELQDSEEKQEWFRELTIFPGVEITVSDSDSRKHLLGVFDPSQGTENVSAVLGACGITSDFGDEQNTSTVKGFIETVREIINANGIAIPAHIDSNKGLLENTSSLKPNLENSLDSVYAAEFRNLNKFQNSTPELKKIVNQLAKVQGSDAHCLEDIGKNYSWIKMGKPSINSLEWALKNHNFNVKNQTQDPNTVPQIFLSKLQIRNMNHCGRNQNHPFIINFHPHFNSFIGGRGAGKSTVLESIRIASRLDKNLQGKIIFENIFEKLKSFMKPVPQGVMLNDTEIILEVQRNKEKFQLNWNFNSQGAILEKKNENGKWIEVEPGDIENRFEISLFSQKQINELASKSKGILELVDNSPDVNFTTWKSEWDSNANKFFQTRLNKRELKRQIDEEQNIRTKLVDVVDDLKQYEESGYVQILRQYEKRNQQKNGLSDDQIFEDVSSELRKLSSEIEPSEFPEHLFDENDETITEIKEIYTESNTKLTKIIESLSKIANSIDEIKTQKDKKIKKSKWFQDLVKSNSAYNQLLLNPNLTEGELSLSGYGELVRNRNNYQNQLNNIDKIKKEMGTIEKLECKNLKAFKSIRSKLFNNRKEFINKVIRENEYVCMSLVKFGDKDELEEDFRNILELKEGVYKSSILEVENKRGILFELYNEKDNNLIEKHVSNIKSKIHNIAKGNDNSLHGRLNQHLKILLETKPEVFDRLDAWWPKDRLIVKYSKNDSTTKFENLEKGSEGQKAAAILAFLLSYGTGPLVIDQPEDDLDNAVIYDLIVKQINNEKNKRQLIIVTHNPNIVVNGDSELVHVLKFANGQIQIDEKGGLDEERIRDAVCNIMEGGKQAFESRFNKIMQKGNYV